MPPRQYCNRCRSQRRCSSVAACPATRAYAHPCEMTRKTPFVEPISIVVGQARGQNLSLPGGGRGFKAFELSQDWIKRLCTCHSRFGRDMLPGEEKAKELARCHRLDLGSQTLDRIMVNARQKPALAPFVVC